MAKVFQPDPNLANNCTLRYSTADGKLLNFNKNDFDADIESHTCQNGYGVIEFYNPVTWISMHAFKDCSNLTSVTIPDGVTLIRPYAFKNCTNLTRVTIGNGVTSIREGAFEGCTSLMEISIPDSVTKIGKNAFRECENLTCVRMGSGVESIGESAFFSERSSIDSVHISDLSAWCNIDFHDMCANPLGGNLYLDGVLVEELTTITYNIKPYAFCHCGCLKKLIIPFYNSVISIGECAFWGCTSLTEVDLTYSKLSKIDRGTFNGCKSLTNLKLPHYLTEIGECAFCGCTSLTDVTIPNGVIKIGSLAFGFCASLKDITIPNSVYSIGSSAFFRCTSLTDIVIPVERIEDRAFENCTWLRNVTIGDSVRTIGEEAFKGCNSIDLITIPASVYAIGDGAFSDSGCFRVYCKRTTPPFALNHNEHVNGIFNGTKPYLKIYVPRNSISAYKEGAIWKKYSSFIVEE